MKKIFTILLLFLSTFISAQTFEWLITPQINFNSSPNSIGYPTTCDVNGNIYISGFVDNTYTYGEIFGDLFYNKYSTSGELLWGKTITGKAQVYNMISDTAGNIYVAANYVQSMTIDNVTISTSAQGENEIVLKFDSNGTLLWYQEIADCSNFKSVAVDSNDFLYICYDNYNNSYVNKLDPNGNILLTITQQHVNVASSVSVDNEGNIYTAGGCAASNAIYAGVSAPSTLSYNTYIAKYNSDGVFQWVKYIQDITCSDPQVKARTPDEVYFCSTLYGAYTFDNIVAEGPTNNDYDFFIAKLNTTGNFQWVREVPGSGRAFIGKRNFITLDTIGNIYFAGSTSQNVNWGNSITTTSTIYQDALILKYNPSGTILMAKTAGGPDTDRCDGVTVNNAGDIFVSGIARGSSTFETIQHTETNQYQFYPFLTKINFSDLNTEDFTLQPTLLYPNPSSDSFSITIGNQYSKGEIYTVLGQKVKDFIIADATPISIKELKKGTYFVKLDSKTLKLIKN
jgi:Secretion system C-terminal sorting domain